MVPEAKIDFDWIVESCVSLVEPIEDTGTVPVVDITPPVDEEDGTIVNRVGFVAVTSLEDSVNGGNVVVCLDDDWLWVGGSILVVERDITGSVGGATNDDEVGVVCNVPVATDEVGVGCDVPVATDEVGVGCDVPVAIRDWVLLALLRSCNNSGESVAELRPVSVASFSRPLKCFS